MSSATIVASDASAAARGDAKNIGTGEGVDRSQRYAGLSDQLAPQIMMAISTRRQVVSVQLHPLELGVVQIRISIDRDHKVRAVVSAVQPDTVDLLQRHAPGLERTLTDSGLKLSGSDALTFDLGLSGQEAGRQGEKSLNGRYPPTFAQDPADPAQTQPAPSRQYAATGLVDLIL